MLRLRHRGFTAALALAWSLVGGAVAAGAQGELVTRVLGAGGAVFQLRTGTSGELFDERSELASNPVLALEVLRANEIDRIVVPGTEDADQELSAAAFFEPVTETLYLAWATRFNLLHTRITVRWLRDGSWSDPIELAGSAFSEKSAPRIAFTRESFELTEPSGSISQHTRSIVHTMWSETTGLGERVVYTPLVFIDGEPLSDTFVAGSDSIVELTIDADLLVAGVESGSGAERPFAPTLGPSDSPHRLLATLSDEELLSVLSLEPVPIDLIRLGDGVRASIVPIGRLLCSNEGGQMRLAAVARDEIFTRGADRFHESVLNHVASAAEARIGAAGMEQLCGGAIDDLAEAVYEDILAVGTDALDSGRRLRVGGDVRASIVPIGRSALADGNLDHRIRIGRVSRHPLPSLRVGRSHVMPSRDGRRVIVAWEEEDRLSFRETSREGEWSALSNLRIDSHLDLPSALDLLERRISGH
ncbi:MAG TPA: hypothetical protein VMT85_06450 [Thermoanaerobaculia bacterium]|nr:hypothetical protein [Thermoanaerobaculia bacterium]